MIIPDLGKLEEVDLRLAWNHEAHSFTPWLAEHLDQLAEKIGIPLEFDSREVRVDQFSADILARCPLDESMVLIENQLEPSDHNHLGQIITYLAGLEAKTIIWIAREFREAHISAIDWLNRNTTGEFSFFAIQVKAVRIGDSPIAPIFDIVARPNSWERSLHEVAKGTEGRSELYQKRHSFWQHYITLFPEDTKYCPASGSSHRWRRMSPIGMSIIAFLAADCVGVYIRRIRGGDSADVYAKLAMNEAFLSERLGASLGSPSDKYLFVSNRFAETDDRETWDELCQWLKVTADLYESALCEVFELGVQR